MQPSRIEVITKSYWITATSVVSSAIMLKHFAAFISLLFESDAADFDRGNPVELWESLGGGALWVDRVGDYIGGFDDETGCTRGRVVETGGGGGSGGGTVDKII